MEMKKIVNRYNKLMWNLAYEHKTIGTLLSEDTEDWNLRDMVAEADYVLSTYYECGHCNNDLKYEYYNEWIKEVGKLKRFIERFKDLALTMECTTGHCSQYD